MEEEETEEGERESLGLGVGAKGKSGLKVLEELWMELGVRWLEWMYWSRLVLES